MVPPGADGRRRITSTAMGPAGMVRQIIEDSRQRDRAQVTESDDGRQFYQLHPAKRIVIMFAGPLQNLILAVVLFIVIVLGIGVPTTVPTVGSGQPVRASRPPRPATDLRGRPTRRPRPRWPGCCRATGSSHSPGTQITSWDQMRDADPGSAGQTVPLVYERNGVRHHGAGADRAEHARGAGRPGRADRHHHRRVSSASPPRTEYQHQSVGTAFAVTGQFIGTGRARRGHASRLAIPALWDSIFNGKQARRRTPRSASSAPA